MATEKDTPNVTAEEPVESSSFNSADSAVVNNADGKRPPPLVAKLMAVVLISCISFGSHWSSGVTGAMKSTLKKKMHITNTQFSLLEASEDFMATALLLVGGIVTDRVGGAQMIVYGNIVYTIGSILVAAATTVRSFKFMVGGRIILSLGDIATQTAQYKMFSSWFAPSNGFASTLGFELAIGKIGGFVGKSTANIIATNTGNFAWSFWMSVFMNLFTNAATCVFWFFNRYCDKHFRGREDKATEEVLTEKNKRFELRKMFQLPWMFWAILAFSMFQTSTASVFSSNATELAEKRFNVDAITAGWYSALAQYAGFFLVPCLGVFIDVLGHRASVLCVCGLGIFISMVLVNFATSKEGTAAAFGIYAVAVSLGPTSIIDGIRTTLWHQSVFGSAYAIKVTMNNAYDPQIQALTMVSRMTIIIGIITGALQDADDDSYRRAVRVFLFLAICCSIVSIVLLIGSIVGRDLAPLQWTRKKRLTSGPAFISELREDHLVTHYQRSRVYISSLLERVTTVSMHLPPEIIQLIIEYTIPPNPPVAFPMFSGEVDTLVSLTFVSRFTRQIARRLLTNHCLLIDEERLLQEVLDCQPPDLVSSNSAERGVHIQKNMAAGLVLALVDAEKPTVAKQIDQLSFYLCRRLTRLVIDLPLRFYHPQLDDKVRSTLREAFLRLTQLEEFCSATDDLCLDTKRLPLVWEVPSAQLEEDDYEPAVWSLWPRLRRLALCEVDVTSMQFLGGLRRCSNLTHLVLVAPSNLDRATRSGWQGPGFLPSLERLLVVDSADEFEMVGGKDNLGWETGFVQQLFQCHQSRQQADQGDPSKDEKDMSFESLVTKIAFPVPAHRKGDDDIICHGWLLDASIDGTIWNEPYGIGRRYLTSHEGIY
ncbi:MFS general substrate transporter [Aspergillus heteromorphus CBS 117.55]|uniref:Lysosomal dipeptide transporter MFSD1 n=1 Tax=Aspergillus heteromorphus CBS 117.55 TaxID=1448321 RepID=A0A317WI62_9EURO|nr:MFS general substrate transporter [Aspergillus heteromorphus CBS 117.55]PWY86073.1 MFS general substrate transporter [Aspergillus heteromorphus CBS 117.55]